MNASLATLFAASRHIVFFTGAGASTEPPTSIPDFRSAAGLWRDRDLMESLTRSHFFREPARFWATFRDIFLPWADAHPNAVHRAPPRLAALGRLAGVVTQNIDGLDARLSTGYPVYELHGHLRSATCTSCAAKAPREAFATGELPRCRCGGLLKPDVVLFEDPLDFDGVVLPAKRLVDSADLLVVVGTSLAVAPANSLVLARKSRAPMVILNRDPTEADSEAELIIRDSAGQALSRALDELERAA